MCEGAGGTEVRHVRKLAYLKRMGQPRPTWVEVMEQRRRKTLVVCGLGRGRWKKAYLR
ncbi:hypothetical protein SNOUR_41935 [Streptomyces noursei ATCC 11455]|uniref:HNH endonuclease n=1 Tax=Streptomyces noursei TaxID=1971 RepID=UPI00081CDF8B|nr:hypothetical protein SNOUR_41935 [Streptomyces noursei ATCC 11455]